STVTAPTDGFFVSTPATSTSNNVLSECSTCDEGYVLTADCTDTSDTVCTVSSVDCVGSWSDWSACSAGDTCVDGTRDRTYSITTPVGGDGADCEAADNANESEACAGTGVVDDCGYCNGNNAAQDDCGDCNGNNAAQDECSVCDGDGSSCSTIALSFGQVTSDSVEILYTSSGDISGYQFDVTGLDVTAGTGAFGTSVGNGTVVGYNFGGADMAAGSGVLVTLSYSAATAESSVLSLGNFGAITDGNGNAYATVTFGDDLVHGPADCAGVFGGDAALSGCDNTCNSTLVDDCAGVCGGDSVLSGCDNACNSTAEADECSVCDGDGSSCSTIALSFGQVTSDSVEILYTSSGDISGYQFDVTGLDVTAGTGAFGTSVGNGTVVGYNFGGSDMAAGSGVLVTLSYSAATAESSVLSLGNFGAITDGNGNAYATVTFGDDLVHGPADCAGVFGGDSWASDCGCVAADNSGDDCDDCAGTPNGDAVLSGCDMTCNSTATLDDCGVCDGDGSTCRASLSFGAFDSSGSVEIMYDFGSAVAGFQFDVTGLSGLSAAGGAAEDAGFGITAGANTIIGFSMTGAEIAAGSGLLTVLSFDGVAEGMTMLSLGNFGAITPVTGDDFVSTVSGSIDHGTADCAGVYYGTSWASDCGCVAADNSGDD
ncbi:hypothetical protein OAQ87_02465, partial [Candidatus Marinimicrobia bacterium]|nr:hypothetical protein [Candidatus Neomarinimicrobiota bacterium]